MVVRWLWVIVAMMGWLVACSPAPTTAPQRVALRIQKNTATATTLPSPTVGPTQRPTLTPTDTNTPSRTPLPTATSTPTRTASPTALLTTTSTPFVWQSGARYSNITFDHALRLLRAVSVIHVRPDHIRRIYARGQIRNLLDDFLLNVGDCNTESVQYLEPLTYLDDVAGLGSTTSQPMSLPTIATFRDSFHFKGQSVNSGLNALAVMDPFWANTACHSGESPLACDVRETQPFAALILFAANDINVMTLADYEVAMREIIEYLLAEDIIPILSTFTVRSDGWFSRYEQAIYFNAVVVLLAEEYDIPLINFWREAQSLPDRGILTDNAHLKESGFEIRNRLTIEMLETIHAIVAEDTRS